MKRCLHFIDTVSNWTGQVVAPLVLVIMAIIIIEIVARYVFNSPTVWVHETSGFLFGGMFMLGGAYCLWSGSMVNVEILHDRLPPRSRAVLDLFLFSILLIICGTMIWYGGTEAWYSIKAREVSFSVWGPPLYPLKTVIPIAAFLLLIQGLAKFTRDLHLAVTGENLE